MRRTLACLAVLLALGGAAAAEPLQLSPGQTRLLAREALARGDTATAIAAARGLLQADPQDPMAYFVLSHAHAAQGDLVLGRKAAKYAFRYATTAPDKVSAGEQAARLAAADNRPGLAQVWLRRTAIHMTDPAAKDRLARDYRYLRQVNPVSFNLALSVRPSSNVNNGADDSLQVIEGLPVTGILSGAAQALSGTIGTVDLDLGYRLAATEDSRTSAGVRVYSRHVALSSEAQALAPTARNSDFSSQVIDLSLQHVARAPGGAWSASAAAGQTRSGDQSIYRFLRLGGHRSLALGEDASLSLRGNVEERYSLSGTRYDATAATLGLSYAARLENGDRLALSFGVRDTDATFTNDIARTWSVRAGYALGQPVGPVHLDAALTFGYKDLPLYRSGLFMVPGGRQDRSALADVTLTFQDWDYAGFVPSVTVSAARTKSNDSRFTTREVSLSFGIQSRF